MLIDYLIQFGCISTVLMLGAVIYITLDLAVLGGNNILAYSTFFFFFVKSVVLFLGTCKPK